MLAQVISFKLTDFLLSITEPKHSYISEKISQPNDGVGDRYNFSNHKRDLELVSRGIDLANPKNRETDGHTDGRTPGQQKVT